MQYIEPTNFIKVSGNKINPNAGTNKIHIAPENLKGCCDGVPCVAQFTATVVSTDLIVALIPLLNSNTKTGAKISISDGVGGVYAAPITSTSITIALATLANFVDTTKELTIWVSVLTDAGECKGVLKTAISDLSSTPTYSQNYQCPLGVIVPGNIVDAGADITVTVTGLVVESGGNTVPISWTVSYWAPGDDPTVDAPTGTITNATSSPVTIAGAANGVWIFMITEYVLQGNNCTETLNPANYANIPASQIALHTQA